MVGSALLQEKVREYRLADRRANGTTETGRISPRVKPRVASGNTGATGAPCSAPPKDPKGGADRQTAPTKQRPPRMVENEEILQTSPAKNKNSNEILPVRAPFLDRTNNELGDKDSQVPIASALDVSPAKILTPREGLLTPDRWAIRSPLAERMEVRISQVEHSLYSNVHLLCCDTCFSLIRATLSVAMSWRGYETAEPFTDLSVQRDPGTVDWYGMQS